MIPIIFITDENFIMQTGIAITSLISNRNKNTIYDIYIIAAECKKEQLTRLEQIDLQGSKMSVINVSLQKYLHIKQLAHIPISCLLKFEICDMVPMYDKLIYLDGDIYVRGDLSELYDFELNGAYIAGVPSIQMVHSEKRMINAGIMLFNAKKMRENNMSACLIEVREKLGDRGSMDQQTFNMVMEDSMLFLPLKYNFIPETVIGDSKNKYPIEVLNKLYRTSYISKQQMVDDAVIIHYAMSTKPWKYTFVSCGDEWYKCYRNSVYGREKLRRDGRLMACMKRYYRIFQQKGISGVLEKGKAGIMKRLGENSSEGLWG